MNANTGRPSTITKEDLLRWRKTNADYLAEENNPLLNVMLGGERGLEVWYCGEWFGEMLKRYGATPEEMAGVLFANGQRLAFTPTEDLWKVTEESLAKFLQGSPDIPGAQLAAQLIAEVMQ